VTAVVIASSRQPPISPGQHSDGVDRRSAREVVAAERLQEADVGAVHVPQQVDDRVGLGAVLFVGTEERQRPHRHIGRDRGETGRVDERVLAQAAAGHLDVEPVHAIGRMAQVHADRAGLPPERPLLRGAAGEVHDDPVRRAVPVPGDDLRALARVGRR
jgi:hypothetical protein